MADLNVAVLHGEVPKNVLRLLDTITAMKERWLRFCRASRIGAGTFFKLLSRQAFLSHALIAKERCRGRAITHILGQICIVSACFSLDQNLQEHCVSQHGNHSISCLRWVKLTVYINVVKPARIRAHAAIGTASHFDQQIARKTLGPLPLVI
jgi:hypothetical protein